MMFRLFLLPEGALFPTRHKETVRLRQTDGDTELIPSFWFEDRFRISETVVRAKGEATR